MSNLLNCFHKQTNIKWIATISLTVLMVGLTSCREDFNEKIVANTLEFSKDTVFLDTIFSNISSRTYSFKVYNRENIAVTIPNISLKNENSNYRLNVDGEAGVNFNNVSILAKDSLFVFIETTATQSEFVANEFLNTDAIKFTLASETKEIQLVSLVKDAIFLFPSTNNQGIKESILLGENESEISINGFYLEDNQLVFTKDKPYVIYGYATVPPNKTLQINAGSRVFFHKDSGILVSENASLEINGTSSTSLEDSENEVVFEGDRLETAYENTAGQWGTIWLSKRSVENKISNLTLKNATIGILCEGENANTEVNLNLVNSQIYNSSFSNLWAINAIIRAENCVFGNSGESSVYLNLGGNYEFLHSTFANYWTSSFRNSPTLLIDNFIELSDGSRLSTDLQQAYFGNCIVDGNQSIEFLFFQESENIFNINFESSLLKFNDVNNRFDELPIYDFTNNNIYVNTFINRNTGFLNPTQNIFFLTEGSEAIGAGNFDIGAQVPFDLLGNSRANSIDAGAVNFFLTTD